jgi:hypothetical protein
MAHRPHGQEEQKAGLPPQSPPPTFFLRTKLLPPRPGLALLSRPRLVERLVGNLARPVTLVTANAGSGKTTLVADFIRLHSRQFVWYQLDHTDADPAVFLSYIAHGIQQVVPAFGQSTLAYLRQAAAEVSKHPERAVDVLLNEVLDAVDQQLIIVLDDYHHLGSADAVHAAVDRLLAYLPDVLHAIIISRDIPPLQLARLRSQSALMTIDRNDLLFTDEETSELLHHVFGMELSQEQLREFSECAQGWIMALQMIRQVAQRQASQLQASRQQLSARAVALSPLTSMPDLSGILRQSERDLFDFFSNQPLKQNFLLYRDGNYLLNPDFTYAIDIEVFDHFVLEGESARRARQQDRCIEQYEAAIKLYRGEFMQGCYEEWVREQRSYYREQYIFMLETLAVAAKKAEEWPRALHLAYQILRDDPYKDFSPWTHTTTSPARRPEKYSYWR